MFMRRKELRLLWKMEDVKSMIGPLISNGYLVMRGTGRVPVSRIIGVSNNQ